jgi:hypothetical protein
MPPLKTRLRRDLIAAQRRAREWRMLADAL